MLFKILPLAAMSAVFERNDGTVMTGDTGM